MACGVCLPPGLCFRAHKTASGFRVLRTVFQRDRGAFFQGFQSFCSFVRFTFYKKIVQIFLLVSGADFGLGPGHLGYDKGVPFIRDSVFVYVDFPFLLVGRHPFSLVLIKMGIRIKRPLYQTFSAPLFETAYVVAFYADPSFQWGNKKRRISASLVFSSWDYPMTSPIVEIPPMDPSSVVRNAISPGSSPNTGRSSYIAENSL